MVDYDLGKVVGDKGETGNGIASITLYSTSGKVKTYRITYTDGSTFDFQVRDGNDASVTVDSSLSSTSVNPVQNKVINSALDGKASSSHSHSIGDVSSLQSSLDGKSDTGHTHTKSNITDFAHTHDDRYYTESETDTLLSGKASSSHSHSKSDITDFPSIPSASSTTPSADTTNGSVGTGSTYARSNHTHPKSSLYAEASHTHTKAEITDFPTTMTPSSHSHGSLSNTGTLNSDITSVNKVAVTDSSNNLKTIAKLPFANLNITKANITGLGIPSQDTTYAVVNATENGLMSSTDKSKLDGIATGATKNVIDTALSSTSTNAVQNKVINTALAGKASSSHTHTKSQITDFSHTHDDRYFTESEMNTKLALKQDKSGLAWTPIKLANNRIILYYNDYYCSLEIKGDFTPTVANAWTNLTGSTLDSAYRPATSVTTFNDGDVLIRFKVNSEGTIQYYSPQTFSSANTLRAVLNWVRH